MGSQMRCYSVTKSGAISLSVLLVALILAASVAASSAVTSENDMIQEATRPAPMLLEKVRQKLMVRSSAKKKRAAPRLVAQTIKIERASSSSASNLLPAVNQPGITDHHKKLADAVLRSIPAPCRTNLKNFYVQYKDVKQRGLGGKTTIIIDGTASDEEFVGLLIHECAHVTHANMPGTVASGESAFRDGNSVFYNDSPITQFFAISWMTETIRNGNAKDADFASGYGKSDAFEDFAESFALYVLHRDAFEERAKTNAAMAKKLAWMEQNFPIAENVLGTDQYTWDKKVPWDVTKLPYSLAFGF